MDLTSATLEWVRHYNISLFQILVHPWKMFTMNLCNTPSDLDLLHCVTHQDANLQHEQLRYAACWKSKPKED